MYYFSKGTLLNFLCRWDHKTFPKFISIYKILFRLTIKKNFKASGREVKYQIGPRRPGDLGNVTAVADLSFKELGWKATRDLDKMCQDHWRWQSENPYGYRKKEDAN